MFFCSFLGINPHIILITLSKIIEFSKISNKGLFYANFYWVLQEILFMRQKSSLWGLGPESQFWVNWDQKTYTAISPEPGILFSQTRTDFMQNVKLKKMFYLSIYKNIPSIRSLGPKNLFWANWAQKMYQAIN